MLKLSQPQKPSNLIAAVSVCLFAIVGTYMLIMGRAATETPVGSITTYIKPEYQTGITFGDRSHWIQPWRGYLETPPAQKMKDALGVSYNNLEANEVDAAAQLLKASGFKTARVEWGWNTINYTDETKFTDPVRFEKYLLSMKNNGLRPLILLNSNHGRPTPHLVFDLKLMSSANAGATSVKLDPTQIGSLVPGKSGIREIVSNKSPEVIFTSIAGDGTATLSKPLPTSLNAGTIKGITIKYEPFQKPFLSDGRANPKYEETLAGWLKYVQTVTTEAKRVLGNDQFDIEIWNELSFGSDILSWNTYYGTWPTGQGDDCKPCGDITHELPKRTVAWVRDPIRALPNVGITNGFESQRPWASGATMPSGLTAMSKHYYKGLTNYPKDQIFNGIKPKDALGQHSYTTTPDGQFKDIFVPTYDSFFPEYYMNSNQTENLIRDISPLTTDLYGTPHGRLTSPDGGKTQPKIWMTEYNIDPAGADLSDPSNAGGPLPDGFTENDARHMQAKGLMRYLASWVNKGLDRVYFYTAKDHNLSLVHPNFFTALQASGGAYPGDIAGGEIMDSFRRFNQNIADTQPITAPRQITLDRLDDYSGNKQFEGNGTVSHPPLYNRDTFGFFPYQMSDSKFVVPLYIMTRDMATIYKPGAATTDLTRYDLPPERYRLTIGGVNGQTSSVSYYDPLTGRTELATKVGGTTSQLIVEVEVTDYPRLLTIDTNGSSTPVDITPPTTFTLSQVNASTSQMNISWTASSDQESGLKGYDVYRDGIKQNSIMLSATTTTFGQTGSFPPGQTYNYVVRAINNSTSSDPTQTTRSSNSLAVVIPGGSTTPPGEPASGTVIANADFENGTVSNLESYTQCYPGDLTFPTGGAAQGTRYANFKVREGFNEPDTGDERCEAFKAQVPSLDTYYTRQWIKIPAASQFSEWLTTTQWKTTVEPAGSPPLDLFLLPATYNPGYEHFSLNNGNSTINAWKSPALQRDKWYRVVIKAYYHSDPTKGWVEVWFGDANGISQQTMKNGQTRFYMKTAEPNSTHHFRFGIRRNSEGNSGTTQVQYDSIQIDKASTPPPPPTDTTKPTVTLTEPANGNTVSGTITATANAADNSGSVSGVQFKVDGQNVGSEDMLSPYNLTLNTLNLSNSTHTISAVARDAAGNLSDPATVTVTVSNTDTVPPNPPALLSGVPTQPTASTPGSVALSWPAATDNGAPASGIKGYYVYRGTTVINPKNPDGTTALVTATNYTDSNVPVGTHAYSVRSVDNVLLTSTTASPNYNVTITVPADTAAPSVPTGLRATASSMQVDLTWNASTDSGGSGLRGYNVYRNGATTPLNTVPLTTTTFGDGTVQPGTPYTYQVEAVDGAGNKSTKTTPVSVTTLSTGGTTTINDGTTGTGTNQFEFTGSWTYGTEASSYGGDEHYSNAVDASYQVRFSGTQAKVYTTKDPRHGIMAVSIDGGAETLIDTYAASRAYGSLAYTTPTLTNGPHTVKVRVTGTKNAAATSAYIVADRVVVDSPSPIGTTTLNVLPSADTYVSKKFPTRNYGTSSVLNTDSSPDQDTLLRFTISGVGTKTVKSAKLRLYVTNSSANGGSLHRLQDNTWSETGVTWNSVPAADSTTLAQLGSVTSGIYKEVDVTSLITGDGTYGFKLNNLSRDTATYSSKEATNRPQLIVTFE